MSGYARYTAVLDACVLYPVSVADALMSLAVAGFYAAKWTRCIEDEWIRSLESNRPGLAGKLDTRRDAMRDAIPDWEVPAEGCGLISGSLNLPDPDDQHVLAAAVVGSADCIVTYNLKDFPAEICEPLGIEVTHPDDFLVAQIDLKEIAAMTAFKAMRARSRQPPYSPEEFIATFQKNRLVETAERLQEAIKLI